MPPDAEDGSASPELDSEEEEEEEDDDESGMMAEGKGERASVKTESPRQGGDDSKESNSKPASKSNAKDPSRPRRKKARRACFACQRAHLTCGDERPCMRCVKRGLQDQCHDGVRKKAKYLHDAPAEALIPGFASNYHLNGSHPMQNVPGARLGPHGLAVSQPGNYYPQTPANTYPQYSQLTHPGSMGPPTMDSATIVGDYTGRGNVESPPRFQSSSSQQISPAQVMAAPMDRSSALGGGGSFDGSFVDPTDPSLFNFNIADMNFGNHYGALEFGMLGHMSSGAVNTPDIDAMNSMSHSNQGSMSYDGSTGFATNFAYNQPFQLWQNIPTANSRQSSSTQLWGLNGNNNSMDAFAVGETNSSIAGASDHSHGQDFAAGYSSSTVSPEMAFVTPEQSEQREATVRRNASQSQGQKRKRSAFPNDATQALPVRRPRRDTSEIYESVNDPYPYTQAFHALTAFLHKRFPKKKVLRIAKALASIRPSFIACNKGLNHADLVFMEKCCQRALWEYEDFVNQYGTLTIICRRTGEIAAMSKEFSLVTGWRRDVLMGKEPNLNVNTGESESGTRTGSSSNGTITPRAPNIDVDYGRPQPVFLAELMDEDSVVHFYEDFAELAFGASRSSIIGANVTLLKYKTKDDPGWGPGDRLTEDDKRVKKQSEVKSEPLMKGEAGMNALGEGDGRVDVSMCWTVKRDMFDIPMLIVMNFLPII